jgi:hypothetical protein
MSLSCSQLFWMSVLRPHRHVPPEFATSTRVIVTRTVHAEVPPRVEYALTPLGRTLLEPIDGLAR